MPPVWIVHRDPRQRAALVRLAAADDAVVGAPGDPRFDSATPPRVVLLGLSGDFEAELEFARRSLARLRDSAWILLLEPRLAERARRLFDTVAARLVGYPPEAARLRAMIRDAADRPAASPLPLSARAGREALRARFSRWFADLEIPELLRALDPRLADVPVLVRGEPGTGRGTLARYLHAFGGSSEGALVHVPCSPETGAPDLLAAIAAEAGVAGAERGCTLWLEEVDRLPPELQRRVAGWIDYGLPAGSIRAPRPRWIGTADDREQPDRSIEPELLRSLAGFAIRIPPLRDRLTFLPNLANNTASAWCAARGEAPRRFGEDALAVLEEYPWPGNLRELEAAVAQSLAAGTSNPVVPEELRIDGALLAPLDAEAIGTRLEDAPPPPIFPGTAEERSDEGPIELGAPIGDDLALEEEEELPPAEPAQDEEELPPAEPAPDEEELPPAELADEEELPLAELVPEPEAPAAPPAQDAPGPPAVEPPAREPAPAPPVSDAAVRRLADALSHEVRNPLTAIRTFAELLPERYGDRDFRGRFARHVTEGVERVDRVIDALGRLAALGPPDRKPVDVSQLLESALDSRRQRIRERHLLVLKELDPERPLALCDAEQMKFAFDVLLDHALEMLPERGDLYLASRRHAAGLRGGPSVRVLLRLQTPGRATAPGRGLSPAENSLGLVVAEAIAKAQGGSVAIAASDPRETLVLMDLPAQP